jgi:cytoskeletal protein CcmA (bactofilin family)
MFDRKKHAPPQKRIDCLIGAGTTVKGDVSFTGGLRIDGVVQGNVTTANGETGTLVVVNGPITADNFLELQAKAKIVGDIEYRTLEMHLGAVVQGKLHYAEPGTASVVELKRVAGE